MAKWIFALLVLCSASTQAQARELAPLPTGCTVLNEIVYEEVTASRWGMTGADLAHTNMREPGVVICSDTAQTVSRAFANAIQTLGGELEWQDNPDIHVDACLSGFLEQCLPRGRGLTKSLWLSVSNTVLRAMPDGQASDRSIFSRESMRLAVRSSLRRSSAAVANGKKPVEEHTRRIQRNPR